MKAIATGLAAAWIFAAASPPALAVDSDGPDFDTIAARVESLLDARRVRIPFLGIANFFVKAIRPAGVRDFRLAIFNSPRRDLALDRLTEPEFGPPTVRVRKRNGESVVIYSSGTGSAFRMLVITANPHQATVISMKLDPGRLLDFVDEKSRLVD